MEYVDAKGRLIKITDQDSDIEAYYQDKRIGSIEFDLEEQEQGTITYLWYMYVDADYQMAGIATEMMRLAVEIHGKDFRRPRFCDVGGSDVPSHKYYTQDGAALIWKCINMGILDHNG